MNIKLSTGVELTLDFGKVSYKEMNDWLKIKRRTDEDVFKMIGRVSGKNEDEVQAWYEGLPYPDAIRIRDAFWDGVAFPNGKDSSVNVSTGE